jgi:hypothetical protein
MRFAIQVAGYLIGLPLEILIIAAMLRGPYRRFPVLFLYTIANFLTTLIEIPAYVAYYAGNAQDFRSRAWLYWLDEQILLTLIFLVVLSLIWHATGGLRSARLVRFWVIAGAVVFAAGSFLIHHKPDALAPGQWMTPWTRDLYFGSAILDLALWTLLIAAREKDRLILMLSGALGIQFTGEAIGGSIRTLSLRPTPISRGMVFGGDIVILLANLFCLYFWWQALRDPSVGDKRAAAAGAHSL